ncbi:MAG TPA: ABC transporter permease [Bacillota bacterium]|nr:ABC transporter permease [Bacillota bacterium]
MGTRDRSGQLPCFAQSAFIRAGNRIFARRNHFLCVLLCRRCRFWRIFFEVLVLLVPYIIFAIVALSILITGLVKTVQQFNPVLSIVTLSMAMIGRAFWPLEVVESGWLLAIAKIVPVTHGVELMNGSVVYGRSMNELLFPVSVLLLMGVAMAGVGMHLMERRHV